MPKRPTSITIICWIIIILTGLSIIPVILGLDNPQAIELMKKNPLPINAQYILMAVGFTISIVCAIAMLNRQNWARHLYIGWSIIGLIIGFLTSPAKLLIIPSAVILAIMAFFFYRPAANDYFKGEDEDAAKNR